MEQDKMLYQQVIEPNLACGDMEEDSHGKMGAELYPLTLLVIHAIRDSEHEESVQLLNDSLAVLMDGLDRDTKAAFACSLLTALEDPLARILQLLTRGGSN